MEIGQSVPVALEDSPILYSYIMWIHNKINPHTGVDATVQDVCKKMKVPCEKDYSGLRQMQNKDKEGV